MIDYRTQAPPLLRDFLMYHETIQGHSKKTVDEYFLDLRNFFRYIKIEKGIVPRSMPLNEISIDDVGLDLVRSVSLADIYAYYSSLYVYPTYVKGKVSEIGGTQDDEMMIDHILKNVRFDWGFVKGVSAVKNTLLAGIAEGKNTVPELAAEKGEALSEAGELLITSIKECGG